MRWRDIGSESFDWGDFRAIIRASGPGTAVYRELSPDRANWTATDYILADLFDAVRDVAYTVAKSAGSRKVKRPKPYTRPGVKSRRTEVKKFGSTLLTRAQLAARFKWDAKRE